MTNTIDLHFTLGPVQGFVSESRRTRDLWASSYLLSFLARKALQTLHGEEDCTIILPDPSVLKDNPDQGAALPHGTIPNRFQARVPNDPERIKEIADNAKKALLDAWFTIADAVWKEFIENIAHLGNGDTTTKEIWDRQVNNFWEINWAAGEGAALLDKRKNWRSPALSQEGGSHCTMMSRFQEISGHLRSQEQQRFWNELRNRTGTFDLGDDERLCAIALIKRFYPAASQKDRQLLGHKLNPNAWPSTAYLAAIPWMEDLLQDHPDKAEAYAAFIKEQKFGKSVFGERKSSIEGLKGFGNQYPDFIALDGNFFHQRAIESASATPLGFDETKEGQEEDQRLRKELIDQLKELTQKPIGAPSPIYALLLMDGDSMGKLIDQASRSSADGEGIKTVSSALTAFANRVPGLVSRHNGVTVYAGGDDVLAMLPLESALSCADDLSKLYERTFKETAPHIKNATLSGAIVYTDYANPLRAVLASAHHLLDDIAKDQTGRDSLAIGIFKSSGLNSIYSAPWTTLRKAEKATILDDLLAIFRAKPDDPDARDISSSFFYRLRDRFGLLADRPLHEPGQWARLIDGLEFETILAADYKKGRKSRADKKEDISIKDAKADMAKLLKVSQRYLRHTSDDPSADPKVDVVPNSLGIDGAMVVRFLATQGHKSQNEET